MTRYISQNLVTHGLVGGYEKGAALKMSFAIEVPGETTPLNPQDLIRVLEAATSNNHTQRQSATAQLAQWESTSPEFFPALQSVFLTPTLPYPVRFLAIIQLKNAVDKHWRAAHIRSTSNVIRRQEKDLIRANLFRGTVAEPDPALALHNALVVAKVVRIDYPAEWPDALGELCALLRRSAGLVSSSASAGGGDARLHTLREMHGVLVLLLAVVKELATARLRKSQTALQSVAPELVFVLVEVYREGSVRWMQVLAHGAPSASPELEMEMKTSLLALRVLRRLVSVGYEYPHLDKVVQALWSLSQEQLGQLLALAMAGSDGEGGDQGATRPYQEIAGKHLLQFTKLHLDMSESHAASFVVLPGTLPLVRAYWDLVARFAEGFDRSGGLRHATSASSGSDSAKAKIEGPLLERLALKGLLLLRACVRMAWYPAQTFKYKNPQVKEEEQRAISTIKTDLLTEDLVVQIVDVIITRLFIFRRVDLEAWEEAPEEWEDQERNQGSAWEWEVRPCAEKLFLDLLTHYGKVLVPLLLRYFQTVHIGTTGGPADDGDIVAREAAYTVMGLGAALLHEALDFEQVLATTVAQDASRRGPLYKVLRRRIAILISQWTPVKMTPRSRALAYDMFRHFLDPSDETNDIVVRVTAAREFYQLVEDLDFQADLLVPHMEDLFTRLVALVQEVELDPTKLAVLETLRVLILQLAPHAEKFGDFVMAALPRIWDTADKEEYMIKQSIMAILGAVVVATRTASARYENLMLPLLREAVQPGSELYIHLMDEALELWDSILTNATPPLSAQLIALLDLALPLLEYSSESGARALEVVVLYVLLAPDTILADEGLRRRVVAALSNPLLESSGRDTVANAAHGLELLVQASRGLGGSVGVAVVAADMLAAGTLPRMLAALHGAYDAHQTTGPNRRPPPLSTVTETRFLSLLSHLAVANPAAFAEMVVLAAGTGNGSSSSLAEVWPWLSAEWFASFDGMAVVDERKLSCLGLTALLELPEPMHSLIQPKLQDYFSMWTSVIVDVTAGDGDVDDGRPQHEKRDTLVWSRGDGSSPNDGIDHSLDLPKDRRADEVAYRDPTHAIDTRSFILERLQMLIARAGGLSNFRQEWIINLDWNVVTGLQKLLPQVELA